MAKDDTLNQPTFDDILDALYAAPSDHSQWAVFAERATRYFQSFGFNLIGVDMAKAELGLSIQYGLREVDPVSELYEKYANNDYRLPIIMSHPDKPIQFKPEGAFAESEIFRELLRPSGVETNITAFMPGDENRYIAILFGRGQEDPYYTQGEIDAISSLVPHIKRAYKLYREFFQLDEQRCSALSVLDDLLMGVVVTDTEAQVLYANNQAKKIAGHNDGVLLKHGRLLGTTAKTTAQIKSQICEQIDNALSEKPLKQGLLTIKRTRSPDPLQLRINALAKTEHSFGALYQVGRPLAVVYLTDPAMPTETSAELLQRMYGFTPAEARIVVNLIELGTLKAAAQALGITFNTARSQLKSVFAKAEVSSQVELVKRVMNSPAWKQREALISL